MTPQEFIERYGRVFSPSGSGRWLFCNGSIALETQLKDTQPETVDLPSIYASRGTVAHAVAAACIEKNISPYTYVGQQLISEDEARLPIDVDENMANAVNQYTEHALSLIDSAYDPIYGIEETLDLSHISSYMPSGTCDFWAFQRKKAHLYVVDYKNGAIDVDPKHNTQMMIYALGVLRKLHTRHGIPPDAIERVTLSIAQPNARNSNEPIRSWRTTVDTLQWFHEFVRHTITTIMTGNSAYFAPSESRCRWCRGAAICTERAKLAIDSAKLDFYELMAYEDQQSDNPSPISMITSEVVEPQFPPVDTLTPRELGHIVKWQNRIESFLSDVGTKVLELKRAGHHIPGVKLVRGRSIRRWSTDDEKVASHLKAEYQFSDKELYSEPKLKSPAKIEALIKKVKADPTFFAKLVEKPEGDLKLAPSSDKRTEVKLERAATSDFMEFKQ